MLDEVIVLFLGKKYKLQSLLSLSNETTAHSTLILHSFKHNIEDFTIKLSYKYSYLSVKSLFINFSYFEVNTNPKVGTNM